MPISIDGVKFIRTKLKNVKIHAIEARLDSEDYVLGNGSEYYFIYKKQKYKMFYVYPADEENKYKDIFERIVASIKFN